MPYDELWEFVLRADWRLITPGDEHIAFAIGALVVAAILIRSRKRIRKRIETIETRLSKLQSEVAAILQVQSALITKQNPSSKVEADPPDMASETVPPPTTSLPG